MKKSKHVVSFSDPEVNMTLKRFVKDPFDERKWSQEDLEQHCEFVINQMSNREKITFLLEQGYIRLDGNPEDGIKDP